MEAKNFTKRAEGYRDTVYQCSAGKLTVGYGHNLEDRPLPQHIIEAIFEWDYEQAEKDARRFLGPAWLTLSDVRRGVVTDMAFNMGLTTLSEFRKTRKYIAEGRFKEAAAEMLNSKWARQVGDRAQRLALVMEHDDWSKQVRT